MHKNKIYYLGIEDKNGKEITSNSIIKFKEHKGMVNFNEEFFLYSISGKVNCDPSVSVILSNDGEVSITITQLTKNNYFSSWASEKTFRDSLNRKIQEQYLAIQLEKITPKKTILENYLNTINLGPQIPFFPR